MLPRYIDKPSLASELGIDRSLELWQVQPVLQDQVAVQRQEPPSTQQWPPVWDAQDGHRDVKSI
jgi:hypothetical protein